MGAAAMMKQTLSRRAAFLLAGILLAMPSALAQTALDGYGPKEAPSLVGIAVIDSTGRYIGVVNSVQHDGQGVPIVVKIGMGGIFGFFQRIVPVTVDLVELKTNTQGARYIVVKKTKAQILGKT
jgi:ribosomal 30S subunit maturation factor RimM